MESYTKIVPSATPVEMPDGSSRIRPFFTDLFSPDIDFINEFRFLDTPEGFLERGGTYPFTRLDVNGRPIEGATAGDIWLACPVDPVRKVSQTALILEMP